ncbi:MAG: MFS transporter [Corynebacterium sp.]|uniref:MFS transporter n=1 Tax=unclassified Corynebacterium TaxID=2624378 RepID=UPI0026496644|nr:MFS transporter [Corynebacterium sp.]MDN5581012.1 MFS transporter [Corynebacterium sp.]MDN5719762.1 MFS transporter [Corynebacterium sp.]
MATTTPDDGHGPDTAHDTATDTATDTAALTGIYRGPTLAWAFWDWGSAAFNAVLVTFIFSVYLTDSVGGSIEGGFGDGTSPATWYGWAMAVGGVTIALVAPVMGRRADARGTRRRSVTVWTLVTVGLMFSLVGIGDDAPGYFWAGIVIMSVASVTFEFAEVSYFAMLSQVSTRANVGRVSGFGWSMGYFGGIVLLLFCYLGFIAGDGDTRGLFNVPVEDGWNVRVVAVIAAVWFLASAIPVMFKVPENTPDPTAQTSSVAESYRGLFRDIAELWRTDRSAVWFLIASAVFRDGLAGVFTFGAVLAVSVYGLSPADVLLFGVGANVVSAIGALACGYLDDKVGPKPVIMVSLILLVLDAFVLFFVDGPAMFWIFGLLLCLFVGPAQSASRSYLARICPPGREGQMFGLYATTGRSVSWMAPAAFSLFTGITGEDRFGILGIGVVLLVGLLLLTKARGAGTPSR